MHDKETIHLLQGLPIAALTLLNSHSTFHIHINIVGHISCIYQNTPTVRVHLYLNCNIVMTGEHFTIIRSQHATTKPSTSPKAVHSRSALKGSEFHSTSETSV